MSWKLKENVKYSCSTDSQPADSKPPGCTEAAVVATEVTSQESMCACVRVCVFTLFWSFANVKLSLTGARVDLKLILTAVITEQIQISDMLKTLTKNKPEVNLKVLVYKNAASNMEKDNSCEKLNKQ